MTWAGFKLTDCHKVPLNTNTLTLTILQSGKESLNSHGQQFHPYQQNLSYSYAENEDEHA